MAPIELPNGGRAALFPKFLKPGTVFYRKDGSFSSTEPHYFVVLNQAPGSDSVLVLSCAQSNIEKRKIARAKMPEETLVIVGKDDLTCLSRPSVFDCNSPQARPVAQLATEYEQGELDFIDAEASEALLARLRLGVASSPLVADPIREQVRSWLN